MYKLGIMKGNSTTHIFSSSGKKNYDLINWGGKVKIIYDTDEQTVSIDGVEPIQVKDVGEAIQVVEAAAAEDTNEITGGEEMEEEMPEEMEERAMESGFSGKRMKSRKNPNMMQEKMAM